MAVNHTFEMRQAVRQAHDWVMIGGFTMLLTAQGAQAPQDCMIQPVAVELAGYGLDEALMKTMCAEVEHAGELMRADCPEGSLNYVNVRVNLSTLSARSTRSSAPWSYFITRQIASSESDCLDGIADPRGYIDLHVFQSEN